MDTFEYRGSRLDPFLMVISTPVLSEAQSTGDTRHERNSLGITGVPQVPAHNNPLMDLGLLSSSLEKADQS